LKRGESLSSSFAMLVRGAIEVCVATWVGAGEPPEVLAHRRWARTYWQDCGRNAVVYTCLACGKARFDNIRRACSWKRCSLQGRRRACQARLGLGSYDPVVYHRGLGLHHLEPLCMRTAENNDVDHSTYPSQPAQDRSQGIARNAYCYEPQLIIE
jgi:hypothetical protein